SRLRRARLGDRAGSGDLRPRRRPPWHLADLQPPREPGGVRRDPPDHPGGGLFRRGRGADQGAGADQGRRPLRRLHSAEAVPGRTAYTGPPTDSRAQPLIHPGTLTLLAAVGRQAGPWPPPGGYWATINPTPCPRCTTPPRPVRT